MGVCLNVRVTKIHLQSEVNKVYVAKGWMLLNSSGWPAAPSAAFSFAQKIKDTMFTPLCIVHIYILYIYMLYINTHIYIHHWTNIAQQ